MDKYALLDLQAEVHNWIVSFLGDRSHCTVFEDVVSDFVEINASIIQGSGIGPVSYDVAASDLHPVVSGNEMSKFADDTNLVVPACNSDSCVAELDNISSWSTQNNLKLNKNKSCEIIFYSQVRKSGVLQVPAVLDGIPRVKSVKILGVTISDDMTFSEHIGEVLTSGAQSLHALRMFRVRGLDEKAIHTIFRATSLAKVIYCSPAWWGFLGEGDKDRLEAFIRRAKKSGFCSPDCATFADLVKSADETLYKSIVNNPDHVLHCLLPARVSHDHDLRRRAHNYILPKKLHRLSECNFVTRMLYGKTVNYK
jgi:hypothetical protein